jgi:hypothetical protein
MGSDMWGGAVANACKTLASRLEPLRKNDPDKSFDDVKLFFFKFISFHLFIL